MTRGKIILVKDNTIYRTIEFNGDMYPSGYGNDIITAFKYDKLNSVQSYCDFVKNFNNRNFGYPEELIRSEEGTELDITQNWTDYLYVINLENKDLKIITSEKEVFLPPGCLGICSFKRYKDTVKKPTVKKQALLSRDEFESYILMLKADVEFYTKLFDVCKEFKRQDVIDIYPHTMVNFADLLRVVMNDDNDYICRWCYECEFGKTELITEKNETIKTIDDLYNVLIR